MFDLPVHSAINCTHNQGLTFMKKAWGQQASRFSDLVAIKSILVKSEMPVKKKMIVLVTPAVATSSSDNALQGVHMFI